MQHYKKHYIWIGSITSILSIIAIGASIIPCSTTNNTISTTQNVKLNNKLLTHSDISSYSVPNITSVQIKLNNDQTQFVPGEMITATAVIEPSNISGIEYEWYLDGALIPNQNNKTSNKFVFPVREQDNGKTLTVKILYNKKEINSATTVLEVAEAEKPSTNHQNSISTTTIIVIGVVGGVILLGLILLIISIVGKRKNKRY